MQPRQIHLRVCLFCLGMMLALVCGCNIVPLFSDAPKKASEAVSAENRHVVRVHPYLFITDFDFENESPLLRELTTLRDDVYKELQLPYSDRLIKVHLFESITGYEEFMQAHYPGLPKRRAFFVAQPDPVGGGEDLMVFTYWGDRIREDLRHELTHALLHSVLKDVPLWLDEGLAEFFETPNGDNRVNKDHLKQLCLDAKTGWKPNLERLEKLGDVAQMNPADYREAWAWVHFMLRGNPKARSILLGYIAELRSSAQVEPFRPRLQGVLANLDAELMKHVAQLETHMAAAP